FFPGGFGAAKNLSSVAFDGPDAKVNPEVEKAIKEMNASKKIIGAMCISPVVIAKVLGKINVTIGNEESTIQAIETIGASHIQTSHGEVVCDAENKVYTTPCYMLDANIDDIWEGASNIVDAIMEELEGIKSDKNIYDY
ncbi:MAG: isoprenoid biosynthesis protein ElbB, partial [Ignavibacteria bacterium]|nr:isoprenoid biosynthesis protein ElbB [Ignavibacteria bacterium]